MYVQELFPDDALDEAIIPAIRKAALGAAAAAGIAGLSTGQLSTLWQDKQPAQVATAVAPDAAPQSIEDLLARDGGTVVGKKEAPRVWAEPATAEERRAFVSKMIPIIAKVNADIGKERKVIRGMIAKGQKMSTEERAVLDGLMQRYRVQGKDYNMLLTHVAPVPPSLILAQAAVESGWGKSRLAQAGNALFGQKTTGPRSVDAIEDGTRYAAFDHPQQAVMSYVKNLNSHPAYREFREARAKGVKDAGALAVFLQRYSTKGKDYVDMVRQIMKQPEIRAADIGPKTSS